MWAKVCIYIYIYIYILFVFLYIYIYIYIVLFIIRGLANFIYEFVCIYIYIRVRDSRTGYLIPVRDTPWDLPGWESCWDAAVAVVAVGVTWTL